MTKPLLRVLHVVDSLAPGGKERMLVDLANAAARDGHAVRVCVTRCRTDLTSELRPEVSRLVLGRTRRFERRALAPLVRELRAGTDLVHCHGRSSMSLLAALRLAGRCPAPILFHDHHGGAGSFRVPAWFRVWGRRCVDQYVGVSAALADWARRAGMAPERIHVIPNALDLERVRQAKPAPDLDALRSEHACVGVAVGNLRPDKGTDLLLHALGRMRAATPWRLAFVGSEVDAAFAAACRGIAAATGIADRVSFLGPRRDVPALLKAADFSVSASRSESGPLVLLESLAAALPVVATDVGSIGGQFAASGIPESVRVEDVAGLAAAIERVLALAKEQRVERGGRGQSWVLERFRLEAVMPSWYHVYDAATQGRRI